MKRPTTRLGRVEYSLPYLDKSRVEARGLFWAAVTEEAPEVIQHLSKNVLPIFRKVKGKLLQVRLPLARSTQLFKGVFLLPPGAYFDSLNASPPLRTLTEGIVDWARKFHLDADWIREWAIGMMLGWEEGYNVSDSHMAKFTFKGIQSWTFGPIDYFPTAETEDAFKARIMAEFEKSLDRYIARVHEVHEEVGWSKSKTIELRKPEHFKWLVLYQIKGLSFGRIAEERHCERKTVEDAVKKVAGIVELTLRSPSKGGRPKGSKDSQSRRRTR